MATGKRSISSRSKILCSKRGPGEPTKQKRDEPGIVRSDVIRDLGQVFPPDGDREAKYLLQIENSLFETRSRRTNKTKARRARYSTKRCNPRSWPGFPARWRPGSEVSPPDRKFFVRNAVQANQQNKSATSQV